jgi:hypothetical protein
VDSLAYSKRIDPNPKSPKRRKIIACPRSSIFIDLRRSREAKLSEGLAGGGGESG